MNEVVLSEIYLSLLDPPPNLISVEPDEYQPDSGGRSTVIFYLSLYCTRFRDTGYTKLFDVSLNIEDISRLRP